MRRFHRWTAGTAAAVLTVASFSGPAGAAPAAPMLAPGSVSPSTIVGGDGAIQTIRLTAPAPAGGVDVSITASDVVYNGSAGASVHVPAGATSVSFPFRLSAPETTTVRSLLAQTSGTPLTTVAEVTVLAADPSIRAVTSLRFAPEAALAGTSTTGTVTVKNPAPPGGISVDLWSNTFYGPNVYVPPFVVVEQGRTSATFQAVINTADSATVVRPSADIGTSKVTAPLVVVPPTFDVGVTAVAPGTTGVTAVGIGAAAGSSGARVTLRSDHPGVTVPTTITILAGRPGASFPITVASSVPRFSTAQLTATWNGRSVTTTVYLN